MKKKTLIFAISAILLIGIFFYDLTHSFGAFSIFADTSNQPNVQITSPSATTANITLTFPQAVPSGNIIDIELYDMSNHKVWSSFTPNGGTTYTATTNTLPNGIYRLAAGLFIPNWQSNYAWFNDLTTITIGQAAITTVTPSISPTSAPCVITTPTSSQSAQFQAQSAPSVADTNINAGANTTMMANANNAYISWKNKYVVYTNSTSARVIRPENNNDTVSEGIGYGMLLSVFANDQKTFNALWKYAQKYFDGHGLMQWDISSSGSAIGTGAATDADEDMAYALVQASKQWPNNGYDTVAKSLIGSIEHAEIGVNNSILPGDSWGNTTIVNPSYIAPAYYTAFAQFTGDNRWQQIENTNMSWLTNAANGSNGLLPDWLQNNYVTANVSGDAYPDGFYYDASRVPLRLLLAYKQDNNMQAKAILEKEQAFFANVGTSHLTSGYAMSGRPLSNYLDTTFKSAYAAAGAVEPGSAYANQSYSMLTSDNPTGYFGTTLRTLALFEIAK